MKFADVVRLIPNGTVVQLNKNFESPWSSSTWRKGRRGLASHSPLPLQPPGFKQGSFPTKFSDGEWYVWVWLIPECPEGAWWPVSHLNIIRRPKAKPIQRG